MSTRAFRLDKEIFQAQIKKLKGTYVAGSYPQACIEGLWEDLKHLPNEKFVKAISRAIANNPNPNYPPGIEKIEKELSFIREDDWEKQKLNYSNEAKKAFPERTLSGDEASRELKKINLNLWGVSNEVQN